MAEGQDHTIKFHYIKSPLCRDIHVSGFFGGMNQNTGELHMSVFSERPPIPTVIENALDAEGRLGKELGREGRDGMVRVVQDTMYLDVNAALALHRWLTNHVEAFKRAHPELPFEETIDNG